ncbi:MAG: hypothetical protein JZD41_02385 [Thermoproteus sp.]|nr:hypothetical protein [Thermoproteus sp.]
MTCYSLLFPLEVTVGRAEYDEVGRQIDLESLERIVKLIKTPPDPVAVADRLLPIGLFVRENDWYSQLEIICDKITDDAILSVDVEWYPIKIDKTIKLDLYLAAVSRSPKVYRKYDTDAIADIIYNALPVTSVVASQPIIRRIETIQKWYIGR